MNISFIIGYGGSALKTIKEVLQEEAKKYHFDYVAVRDTHSREYVEFIRSSDAIFIYCSELPEEVERSITSSKARLIISASDSHYHLARGSRETISKAILYFKVGGISNIKNLIHLILKELGLNVEIKDVEYIPWHGIWHPQYGLFTDIDSYLSKYPYRDKPLIGILFYRSRWLYDDIQPIKLLIKYLEDEGLGVVPVFTYSFKDLRLGIPSAEDSIRNFFIRDNKPIIEILLNTTSFFILDHGRWHKSNSSNRFKVVNGIDMLKELGIPIIQLIHASTQSVEDWLNNPNGLDYISQVYQVIMPEVDGIVEPIFLAGSKIIGDEKKFEAYENHVKYIVKRIKRWIKLRRKPPSQRKIAIILINPPCKGLEANIAVGMGLDVPESVVRVLHKLKSLGYNVGENVPKTGEDLVRLILSRKAISEFRWTSVNEIVRCGGAVDFVDEKTYMEWFNELPNEVREDLIKDWGHPRDVLLGRISKEFVGMVYKGKFVIPGILFGNVFITMQPKFGCAGAACDGKVCRILHNPTIKPPHQWLAVYRWITRVFKADIIIHFGTHGYLEFRPGKGVGLSDKCWPEISIDDIPHLYVYVVSNPMEGVIAKRRSYATLVDHLYPPMTMANALEDLESLLTQYHKAKQLSDYNKARIIYDQIIGKAREANISIKDGEPEENIEYIHRYIDMIRNSQINLGLHILGHPPTDLDKLSEYVATIMAYDTIYYPSIRRILAEYLGLNYDEIRKYPNKMNKYGLTNSEILSRLHEVAKNVIKRILQENALGEDEIMKILNEEIQRHLGGNTC